MQGNATHPSPLPTGGGWGWLDDFGQFAPRCLRVYPKENAGQVVPLRLTDIQQRFVKERTARTLVLKARQVRISTACLGLGLQRCLRRRGTRVVTVAQDMESTSKLLERVRVMHRELPAPPAINKDNRRELSFVNLDSSYYIGTAGSRTFGRGDRIHFAHLTEFAFWKSWDVWTGIPQAVADDGEIVIESTPNGFNFFYKMVKDARTGALPYRFLFYPWFVDSTYREAKGVPSGEWTDEEKVCAEKALLHGVTLTPEQVAWRRNKWAELAMEGGGSAFAQEYPEDEQTCFIGTGRPRFDNEHLNAVLPDAERRIPISRKGVEGTAMTLTTWEEPKAGEFYVVSGDTAEGLSAGDNCAGMVLEWRTRRKVAQVWGKADPWQLGKALVGQAERYNHALLAVERNNAGIATLHEVEGYGNLFYPVDELGNVAEKPGWVTTSATRPLLVDACAQFYREARAEQVCADEIGEAMSFVIGSRGRAEASAGAHDDLVMARGIGLMVCGVASPPVVERQKARGWNPAQR